MTTELQHAVYKSIESKKSFQKISAKRRILVSKKAWAARIGVVGFGFFLVVFNIHIGLQLQEPLIIYSDILPLYGILYLQLDGSSTKIPQLEKLAMH